MVRAWSGTRREAGACRLARLAVTALATALAAGGCVVATETGPLPVPSVQSRGGSPAPDGQGYRFLHTLDDGDPVRWPTCRPIRYVVRPANEPEGARKVLQRSVDKLSDVTGLTFEYAGTTDEAPSSKRGVYLPDRYGDQWAPVLVTYSTPQEYPRLKGQAAGFGGPTFVQQGGSTPRYVSGMVVLDAPQLERLGQQAMRAVMLHELAHVVGLAHVNDRSQLMNPVQYGRGVTDLGKGDREGLRALGDGSCYEPLTPQQVRRR